MLPMNPLRIRHPLPACFVAMTKQAWAVRVQRAARF